MIFSERMKLSQEYGEWINWFIRPHDLEDFKLIIDKYGTDWAQARSKEESEG